MKKKVGFTLLELLIVLTIFFFVVAITLRAYLQTIHIKNGVMARQTLIESSHFLMDRLQGFMQDHTIDYEEYFNRRMVGCDDLGDVSGVSSFSWSGGSNGHCDRFTAYGNENTIGGGVGPEEHRLYYCSSTASVNELSSFRITKAVPSASINDFLSGGGCYSYLSDPSGKQSYGQYKANFLDVEGDVDSNQISYGDDDDTDLGQGPPALVDTENVSEIYLVAANQDQRIFLRRKLVASGDWNGTGGVGDVPSDLRYTIQLLRLRGFDAGNNHDFDVQNSTGVYDGQIDTWACDFAAGFVCGDSNQDGEVNFLDTYDSISTLYSGYVMPLHRDDGRVDLLDHDITVTNFVVTISPSVDPDLARANKNAQIDPFVRIFLQTNLYGKNRASKVPQSTLDNFDVTLQTTFATNSFYYY